MLFEKVTNILPWRKNKTSDGAKDKVETHGVIEGTGTPAPKGESRKLSEISTEELAQVLTRVEVAKVRAQYAGINRNRSLRLLRVCGLTLFGTLLAMFLFSGSTKQKLPIDKIPIAGAVFPVVAAAADAQRTGHIVVIKLMSEIDGLLHGEPSVSNTPFYLDAALREAEKDPDLAGIIIEIESPGGSAAASEQGYRIVKAARERLAKRNIRMIAYTSLGAYSGGYYIAMGAGHGNFFADPGAGVANIGVIMSMYNTAGLGELLGITENIIKTGPLKSTGHQWEKLTPEQRAMLQESIGDSFALFLGAVSESRQIEMDTLLRESQLPTGRTNGAWFSAKRALEKKLIDGIIPVEDLYGTGARALPNRAQFNKVEFIEYRARLDVLESVTKRVGQATGVLLRSMLSEMTHRQAPMRSERE